jgi:hypothetical protein
VGVRAVARLAARLLRARPAAGLLGAIERAMDELGYEGDACVDDVAALMEADARARAGADKADPELEQLRRAQAEMDRLARGAVSGLATASPCGSWDPPPPAANPEWLRTLDVIDRLHAVE